MHPLLAARTLLDRRRPLECLAPLALRLYLAPVFWMVGIDRIDGFDNTVAPFGNDEVFPGAGRYLSLDHWIAHGLQSDLIRDGSIA